MKKSNLILMAAALGCSIAMSAAEAESPQCDNVSAIATLAQKQSKTTIVKLEQQKDTWVAIDSNDKKNVIKCVPERSAIGKASQSPAGKDIKKISMVELTAIVGKETKAKIESIEFRDNLYIVSLDENGVKICRHYTPDGKLKSWHTIE